MTKKYQYWSAESGYTFCEFGSFDSKSQKKSELLWEIEADTMDEVMSLHIKRWEELQLKKMSTIEAYFNDGSIPSIVGIRPPVCQSCKRTKEFEQENLNSLIAIIVTRIKSVDGGWVTEGIGIQKTIRNNEHTVYRCISCGALLTALVNILPIECETFDCPKCGDNGSMDISVSKIERHNSGFDFEATIVCKACKNKSKFYKFIEKLFDLVKIEINATGITLKGG